VNVDALRTAISNVCGRLHAKDEDVAMLLPDPVIRVFVQHFEEFPRSPQEALPMLRWKLKKSVPFGVDETVLSYMRQAPREGGVDVLTAFARLRIVREYEELAESVGLRAGVILSSSLAAAALLEEHTTTLLARVPVYPGAASPKTSAGVNSNTEFAARDWTLPAQASPELVIDWYIAQLQARGWKVKGKSFNTIRATRGHASLSVGVRHRTLEVIANSRGA